MPCSYVVASAVGFASGSSTSALLANAATGSISVAQATKRTKDNDFFILTSHSVLSIVIQRYTKNCVASYPEFLTRFPPECLLRRPCLPIHRPTDDTAHGRSQNTFPFVGPSRRHG